MHIYNVTLVILYVMLSFLIASYIRVLVSCLITKMRLHKQHCQQEEEELELFFHELYNWGKKHSNLVNQI